MPPSTLRTAVVLTVMFVVAAAGFVALAGFFAVGTMVSRLQITAGAPTCTGTTVSQDELAVRLRPDMECVLPVTVRNNGRLDVRLESFTLPHLGPDGTAAVQVTSWDGRRTAGDGVDAIFDPRRRLAAGDTWETEVVLEFRPDGCTPQQMFLVNLPEIRAGAWGRSARVPGPGVLLEGTRESDC